MSKRDKILVIVFIVAIIAMLTKTFVFDPYTPVGDQEIKAYEDVMNIIDDEDRNWFDEKLVALRIVNMYEKEAGYRVKVRKYLFGFFAFGEFRIDYEFEGGN